MKALMRRFKFMSNSNRDFVLKYSVLSTSNHLIPFTEELDFTVDTDEEDFRQVARSIANNIAMESSVKIIFSVTLKSSGDKLMLDSNSKDYRAIRASSISFNNLDRNVGGTIYAQR
ncbi:MAG: hypothetical protein ACRC5M_02895 [Anaeroplasmataceae bacterium]